MAADPLTAPSVERQAPEPPAAWNRFQRLITPSRLARPALLYIRQSTLAQVEQNIGSTLWQREQRALALAYGWADSAIAVIDEDLGRSGSSTALRSGWQEMCRLIAANQVGAVFAANAARMSRELRDAEELRILCRHHDTLLVLDGRPVDQDDPNDVAMTQVKATFAQLENQVRTDMMKRARMAKARNGHAVSRLPVGWIKQADGTYDFDPEVRASIAELFARFHEAGSVRALVQLLDRDGKTLPARHGHGLVWKRPDTQAVRFILRNPAYAGQYIYGRTESRPEHGRRLNGHSRRGATPRDRWVVIDNHHPGYVTPAEQQQIRDRITSNRFPMGPGAGTALLQGVIKCALCERNMSPLYKRGHRYDCHAESNTYGGRVCTSIVGTVVDEAVQRIVLNILAASSVDILRQALADARTGEVQRLQAMEATRQRLEYEEQIARERYERTDPRYHLVWVDAQEKLNRALEARTAFERQLATESAAAATIGSEEELAALAKIAADVPALWCDPRVTVRDRKEILRCLVERVLVSTTAERIEGTIVWRTGAGTPFHVHRRAGVYNLVKRLHAEGRTVREIQAWLAAGDRDTGQQWHYVRKHIYVIHKKLGLRPNERRAFRPELLDDVRRLDEQGLRARAVADALNARGLTTPTGRPWTRDSVRHALKPAEKRFSRRRPP